MAGSNPADPAPFLVTEVLLSKDRCLRMKGAATSAAEKASIYRTDTFRQDLGIRTPSMKLKHQIFVNTVTVL